MDRKLWRKHLKCYGNVVLFRCFHLQVASNLKRLHRVAGRGDNLVSDIRIQIMYVRIAYRLTLSAVG